MTRARRIAAALATLLCLGASPEAPPAPPAGLDRYELEADPAARWKLPKRLKELSGLAAGPAGLLYAHDDERATLYQIDPVQRTSERAFHMGDPALRGDFEGLAIAGDRFYLVSSGGILYESGPGRDGQHVAYEIHHTGAGRECEVEGLAHDPTDDVLLLLCKAATKKKFRNFVLVHRWSRADRAPAKRQRLLVPLDEITAHIEGKSFHPSGIERHPTSGNYFIVAARERAVAEITPAGSVVAVRSLHRSRHKQVEGVTFTTDGKLVFGDEGTKGRARLTFYEPR